MGGDFFGTGIAKGNEGNFAGSYRGVDVRGDVYSAGAVLYRMLAGRPPFSGDADSVLRAVLAGPAPGLSKLVPGLPEPVCEVVERAMRRDPADRYTSAAEMLQAIDALAPTIAKKAGASVPTLGGYQRARLEGALVLAASVSFASSVGYATLVHNAALRVPLALLYGSLGAAWGAAVRHAYRRCAESKTALDE